VFIAAVTAFVVKWIWDDKGLERIDYAAQERQEEAERRKI
jgi:hypothetical protein